MMLPPGIWRIGTIHLRTGIILYLSEGCELAGTDDIAEFPPDPYQNKYDCSRRLIFGDSITDAGIAGPGTLDGNGLAFRAYSAGSTTFDGVNLPQPRINLIRFQDCTNMIVRDAVLRDSPFWTLHMLRCRGVEVLHLAIINEMPAPQWIPYASNWNNTDGVNPDSSEDIIINDCAIVAGDDCVVIKNTAFNRQLAPSSRRIAMRRCLLATTCAAFKIGTETLGDEISEVLIEDCDVVCADRAVAVDCSDSASVKRLTFQGFRVAACGQAVSLAVTKRISDQPYMGQIRDLHFNDMHFPTGEIRIRDRAC